MAHSRYQYYDAILIAHRRLPHLFSTLTRDEKRAIYLSYFAFDERYRTQKEVAARLGVSTYRLRRLLWSATDRLGARAVLGLGRGYSKDDDPVIDWGDVREEFHPRPKWPSLFAMLDREDDDGPP
jgi:hypothetical protein